jgi:putative nucleotidyltransferase with HDIG domain
MQADHISPTPHSALAGESTRPSKRAGEETEAPRSRIATYSLFALIAVVFAAGIGITIHAVAVTHPSDVQWELLVAFALLAIWAERTDLSMYGASRISLAFIPIFAAAICCGVTGLAVVVPFAVLASAWGRPIHKTAFNYGAMMISGLAAVGVLNSFSGLDYGTDWPQVILPAALAGIVSFSVNTVLVAAAIALTTRTSLRSIWSEHFFWLLPHYAVLSFIALAMVAAYEALGLWGLAVFVAPPMAMRLSIKQYLDRTTRSVIELGDAHVQLQEAHDKLTSAMAGLGNAYDGTLRSLMAALDARDTETAGHSDRVADLTMAIAAEMGINPASDDWRYMSWGALLHDVGKIAIPDEVLRKPGKLTDEEWDQMRTHPRAGFEILQTIDFLAPACEIVLAHHERYDGAGYPRGLAGEEIPLGARIFMIADAFDAMTSDRSYRDAMPAEEALAEVLRNSGTQFDPAAVRAFLSVYQKRFVGTVHHRHLGGRGGHLELSDSLKRAIAEAAGLESVD